MHACCGAVLIGLGLLAAASGNAEAGPACVPAAPAAIKVTTPPLVTASDQAFSRREILEHVRQRDPAGAEGYDAVLGVTDTDMEPRADIDYLATPQKDGTYCVSLTAITVIVTWRATVHIASELEPGSCMYGVVATHEQGHVEIDRRFMAAGQAIFERALAGLARLSAPASSAEVGGKALQRKGSTALGEAIDTLQGELARRQAAHDTPEEYAKGVKICGVAENNRALGG
jgi:hypothetical protein